MDLALTGDFSAADKAWEKAVTVAPLDETAEYIQNKLAATLALAKLPDSPDAVDWLKVRLVQIMNPESMEKEAEVPAPPGLLRHRRMEGRLVCERRGRLRRYSCILSFRYAAQLFSFAHPCCCHPFCGG